MNTEPTRHLFHVSVEVELVCWADDENDALMEAQSYAKEELVNSMVDGSAVSVSEITSEKEVPFDWRKAVPYGKPPEDDENPWEEYCSEAARRIEADLKVEKLAAEHEAAQVALPFESTQ